MHLPCPRGRWELPTTVFCGARTFLHGVTTVAGVTHGDHLAHFGQFHSMRIHATMYAKMSEQGYVAGSKRCDPRPSYEFQAGRVCCLPKRQRERLRLTIPGLLWSITQCDDGLDSNCGSNRRGWPGRDCRDCRNGLSRHPSAEMRVCADAYVYTRRAFDG